MARNRQRSPETRALPPHLDRVFGLSPSAMTLGLANITALLDRLGNPQRRMRTAVVAGTNGKGSVTAMIQGLLTGEGLRTGRFISPHVYSVTERVVVDGEPATIEEMEAAAERIVPLYEEINYSYFEAITAIAFLVFAERGVDVAVLETGLGGRFDATNVTHPDVTVITSIALDHRRLLGGTEAEILREKLGVTRPGVPLLLGPLSPDLIERCRERARQTGFEVRTIDTLGTVADTGEGPVRITTRQGDYIARLPFPGEHQRGNALLAVTAAEVVFGGSLPHAAASLERVRLPGRFETIASGGHTWIADVAHNDAALCAVARELARKSPRKDTALVFGLMRRKELFEAPAALAAAASRIYLVEPEAPGGPETVFAPHELLARWFHPLLTARPTDAILWNRTEDGGWTRLVETIERSCPYRTILATGSHHVVEEIGRALRAG